MCARRVPIGVGVRMVMCAAVGALSRVRAVARRAIKTYSDAGAPGLCVALDLSSTAFARRPATLRASAIAQLCVRGTSGALPLGRHTSRRPAPRTMRASKPASKESYGVAICHSF